MKISVESLELLNDISTDFVLFTGKGQTSAYHIQSGDMITKEGFELYCDKHYGQCTVVNDDGSRSVTKAGALWWKCDLPNKRVVRRIVMEPTEKPEAEDPAGSEVFNRWHLLKHSMIIPNLQAGPNDCAILLNHLMYLSDGDTEGVTYFLNWLAQLYQTPGIKIPTAIMFYSRFGQLGKTSLYKLLSKVFGEPLSANLNGKILTKQFLDPLEHKRIAMINELARSDKVDTYEWFKNLISEKQISLDGKGKTEKEVRNFIHFIITTNNSDALPLMEEDARILILRCNQRRNTDDYYTRLHAWLDGEGPANFAGLLANWQFPEGWNPYAPVPQTKAVRTTQLESRGAVTRFVGELIEECRAPFDKDCGTCIGLLMQLNALYPDICRQIKINTRSLPMALEHLGHEIPEKLNFHKKDGARSTTRWLCWRNKEKWMAEESQKIAQYIGIVE